MDCTFKVSEDWLNQHPNGDEVAIVVARILGLSRRLEEDRFITSKETSDFDWYQTRWYLGTHNDYWLFQHSDAPNTFTLRFRYDNAKLLSAVENILEEQFNWKPAA